MKYNASSLTARIEQKEVDGKGLQAAWGSKISVIIFEVPQQKSGDVAIEITRK